MTSLEKRIKALATAARNEGIITSAQMGRTIHHGFQGNLDECRLLFEGTKYEDDFEELVDEQEEEKYYDDYRIVINIYNN